MKKVLTAEEKQTLELADQLKGTAKAMSKLEKAVKSGGDYQAAATNLKDLIDDALETAED